jgi:hypothetical protein
VLVCVDGVNVLGGGVHSVNGEGLVVASRETGLQGMVMELSTWLCVEIRMWDEVTL